MVTINESCILGASMGSSRDAPLKSASSAQQLVIIYTNLLLCCLVFVKMTQTKDTWEESVAND